MSTSVAVTFKKPYLIYNKQSLLQMYFLHLLLKRVSRLFHSVISLGTFVKTDLVKHIGLALRD